MSDSNPREDLRKIRQILFPAPRKNEDGSHTNLHADILVHQDIDIVEHFDPDDGALITLRDLVKRLESIRDILGAEYVDLDALAKKN